MRAYKLIIIFALVGGLLGCATGAKMEGMSFQGELKNYPATLRVNIAISEVTGGEDTNPAWTSEIGNDQFLGALIESMMLQGL
ncbi:MAG: hypothetical protein QNJ69_11285, partial [Gammaproteobacteria bacterium]|nr:hypothetical protein [Gammaproteobacteria bacterium]